MYCYGNSVRYFILQQLPRYKICSPNVTSLLVYVSSTYSTSSVSRGAIVLSEELSEATLLGREAIVVDILVLIKFTSYTGYYLVQDFSAMNTGPKHTTLFTDTI